MDYFKIEGRNLPEMADDLLSWYQEHRRTLPFREKPTAYRVWISEIMLQQTRVEAVLPYYNRFIEALPDVKALAAVSDEKLLKLWEGLGYYSRARNLKKAAQLIMERYGGEIPSTKEELMTLPGIGDYTAGAIASIAFGERAAAIDGNVLRVFSRLFLCMADVTKPAVKREAGELAVTMMPEGQASDFNQALMELGALVCLPNGAPLCEKCPLHGSCEAREKGLTEALPQKPKKPERKKERMTVMVLVTQDRRVLLHRRPDGGLLGGMYELPSIPGDIDEERFVNFLRMVGIEVSIIHPLPEARHVFSHIEWEMKGFLAEVSDFVPDEGYLLAGKKELLNRYALPSAFKVYTKILLKGL